MSMDEFLRTARRDFQITYSVIVHSKNSIMSPFSVGGGETVV